jgi:hypothetical protein
MPRHVQRMGGAASAPYWPAWMVAVVTGFSRAGPFFARRPPRRPQAGSAGTPQPHPWGPRLCESCKEKPRQAGMSTESWRLFSTAQAPRGGAPCVAGRSST